MLRPYIFISLIAGSTSLIASPSHTSNHIEVTSMEQFEELKASGKPMLVDVYAPWCGPCKMMVPIIEEVAAEHPHILFIKMNGDTREFGRFVAEQKISGYPSFLLFSAQGQVIDRFSGSCSKTLFVNKLKKLGGTTTPRSMEKPGQPMTPKKKDVMAYQDEATTAMPMPEKMPAKKMKIESRVNMAETSDQFTKEIVESKKPVVIQFMKHGCSTCNKLAMVLDKLSTDGNYSKLKFVQINYDNKKLSGILPKEPGILILPNYHFLGMKELESNENDFGLELEVKHAIMKTHNNPISMPKKMDRDLYSIGSEAFWENKG